MGEDNFVGERRSGGLSGTTFPSSRAEMPTPENLQSASASASASVSRASFDNVPPVLVKLKKWGDYKSLGLAIRDIFVPMKTPLTAKIIKEWMYLSKGPPKHVHTLPEFLQSQRDCGRKVGLIVDLCNHECLYQEAIPDSVAYKHVWCVAKEVPSEEIVAEFAGVVNSFLSSHPGEHVAVHCAYGYNRTGFMICCYLIQELGMGIDEAMHAFQVSRPPGIKHEKFKLALRSRYTGSRQAAAVGSDGHGGKGDEEEVAAESDVAENMEDSLMSLDVLTGQELLNTLNEYNQQRRSDLPEQILESRESIDTKAKAKKQSITSECTIT